VIVWLGSNHLFFTHSSEYPFDLLAGTIVAASKTQQLTQTAID